MRGSVKIRVRRSFVVYMMAVSLLSSVEAAAALAFALCVHELAHYVVIRCVHEPVSSVEITPFGGVMTYQTGRSASKGIRGMLLAGAGPVGNYAAVLLLNVLPKEMAADWIRAAMICNISMMLINLLPVLPLDGGALLFAFGFYLFDVGVLIRVLCALGMVTGACLFLLGIYGWITLGILNLSILVIGGYLVYAAWQSGTRMLLENRYAIIQEKLSCEGKIRQLRIYAVKPKTKALELLRYLAQPHATGFLVEESEGNAAYIGEEQVCMGLLEDADIIVGEVLKNRIKMHI